VETSGDCGAEATYELVGSPRKRSLSAQGKAIGREGSPDQYLDDLSALKIHETRHPLGFSTMEVCLSSSPEMELSHTSRPILHLLGCRPLFQHRTKDIERDFASR